MSTEPSSLTMPDVYDVEISEDFLQQYLSDLKQCAQIRNVIAKRFSVGFAEEESLTLQKAFALLQQKTVRGIQIRYRYQNQEWWDTVLCLEKGYRIVRINPQGLS